MYLFNSNSTAYSIALSKRGSTAGIGGGIASLIVVACCLAAILVTVNRKRQMVDHESNEEGMEQMGRASQFIATIDPSPSMAVQSNQTEFPTDYVPPYSAVVDEKIDLGYYDAEGEFHSVDSLPLPCPPEKAQIRHNV
ncbi:hypothetical protein Cantr_02728 [Candida viswanathii]|uniref:Protein RCR2 n=1 Tax=Candida viswanathii TaxID=5486 RepID=A0A367YNY6_9ASCO|nr:hypothetical protein Cantr_02728 [Candida viswanathii]